MDDRFWEHYFRTGRLNKKSDPKRADFFMRNWKRSLADAIFFLAGVSLYALGVAVFITPSEISPGGVTGIAALLTRFSGLSTGLWVLILNIPLVILGLWQFGGRFRRNFYRSRAGACDAAGRNDWRNRHRRQGA